MPVIESNTDQVQAVLKDIEERLRTGSDPKRITGHLVQRGVDAPTARRLVQQVGKRLMKQQRIQDSRSSAMAKIIIGILLILTGGGLTAFGIIYAEEFTGSFYLLPAPGLIGIWMFFKGLQAWDETQAQR